MERVTAGDKAAFATLFDRHQGAIVRFAWRFVGNQGRAEQRVKAALAADPKLAALEKLLRSTVSAVEALPSVQPSQALRRAVLNGLDDSMSLSQRLQKWLRPSRLMPALGMAAAAALVAVIAQQGAQVGPMHEAEEEQLYVAQNLDVLEDLELAGLESAEDLEVIAALNSLEATP